LLNENFPGIVDALRERAAATITTASTLSVHPNPFNAGTTILVSSAFPEQISLAIYNALGQHVRAFEVVPNQFGPLKFAWDGRDASGHAVASGIYIVKLSTSQQILSKKFCCCDRMLRQHRDDVMNFIS
jgi:hypothetical protein